jgi:pimeloyl-ACP methyl ester carboxylesterase
VVAAAGDRPDLVVVGQSLGGFTAALVAERLPVDALVLVTGMIPVPGENADDWFADTGWEQAVREQAGRDGGLTGSDDPFVVFDHDVPRALAEEALSEERHQSQTGTLPMATGRLVRRAHELRAVHSGPLLPTCLHAPGRGRAPRDHPGRDRRRPLRHPQPAEGTG